MGQEGRVKFIAVNARIECVVTPSIKVELSLESKPHAQTKLGEVI